MRLKYKILIFGNVAKAGKILNTLYVCYFYFLFALFLLALYPFFLLCFLFKWYKAAHFLRKWGCRFVLLFGGIWVKVEQKAPLQNGPYVFCANHSSFLDIIIPIAYLKPYHHYLGKNELAKIPLFGAFFGKMDIAVERATKSGLYQAYQRAGKDLKKGTSIFIFPEGTTNIDAPELLHFKTGAFRLAKEHKVPLVPVTFLDNWRLLHYDKKWDGRPGVARMVLHPPVFPSDDQTVETLLEDVYEIMENALTHYKKHHDG